MAGELRMSQMSVGYFSTPASCSAGSNMPVGDMGRKRKKAADDFTDQQLSTTEDNADKQRTKQVVIEV
jgi:hypothetical protein